MLAIVWDPSATAFSIGSYSVRWYSFCWMIGILLSYYTVFRLYRKQQIPQEKFEPLFFYCIIGILLGARLGHCLLYQPLYYLSHPIEMLLPVVHLPEGGWKMVGYQGLASHGGAIGVLIGLWAYIRKYKVNPLVVIDNVALATPITAAAIRLGNLMNSEIVGCPTDSPLAFVFVQNGENFGRYPAQLFEALWYLLLFVVGLLLYRRHQEKVGTGFYFGGLLTTVFTFRFLIEFLKEVQEPWEVTMQHYIGLNQGQLLSIPFIFVGIYFLCGGKWVMRWKDYFPTEAQKHDSKH